MSSLATARPLSAKTLAQLEFALKHYTYRFSNVAFEDGSLRWVDGYRPSPDEVAALVAEIKRLRGLLPQQEALL